MGPGRRVPIGKVNLPVDIRLLGHLEVSDSGGSSIAVPGERQRGLLALLATAYPRPITADRLIDSLWTETAENPQANLQVAVSRLRKAVGRDVVETVPGGYRLNAPSGTIDVDRFRQLTRRGRQLMTLGHPGKAAEAFRQALAQWRGEPLADLREFGFAEDASRLLSEERLDVVEWLMDSELQAGDHHLVVGELAGLADAHPTRERLWFLLMLALYRCGRQAEALRAYERIRKLLGEGMGIEPSPELSDLEERILLHDPSLADPGIDEVTDREWAEEAQLISFKSGDLIVEEGTPANNVYWIEDGMVEVFRPAPEGDQVMAQLGRGQYFGELASLLGTARTASVRAVTPTTLSVHSVGSFRHRLGVERATEGGGGTADEVADLVRRGDYLRAYDTASRSIDLGNADARIRHLAVLSLAKAGATSLARRRFTALGLDTIDESTIPTSLAEDIAALVPRLDKDMALRSDESDREGWARRSAAGYEAAYSRTSSPYLGANAATMWLLAGRVDQAQLLAGAVLDQVADSGSYWDAVTEAECALVLGRVDRTRDALERAGTGRDSDPAARATTLRQLRTICHVVDIDPQILEPIFNASVVHYAGHRIVPDGVEGRFPASEESRVATELKSHFAELNVGIGFGSLAAGADILAAEALLDMGAELHVALPFERDEFVRASVSRAGPEWVTRFERCLASASSVTTATGSEYLDDPVLFDFCSQIAMGDAIVRADALQTEAIQVAVWDGARHGGPVGTEVDVARWRASGNRSIVIGIDGGSPPVPSQSTSTKREIRGLVFADFAGFSSLSDAQVVSFQEEVMGSLAEAVAGYDANLLSGRTWGDGLYLVFDDIRAAARCALSLQGVVNDIDFEAIGLRGLRGMRVAAHAAPVFEGWDPIGRTSVYFGQGVTKAARIEPRTPEGEVYVTHAFASLAVLAGEETFECNYVGTIETAKGYGPVALYSLRGRSPG